MAIQTNFEMFAGDDKSLDLTIDNGSGTPIPLGDLTEITFVIKETASSATALVTKTMTDGGITITNANAGEYAVKLATVDTQDLSGAYYWESVITDVADGDDTAAFGYIAIKGKSAAGVAYCSLEEALALAAEVQITKNTNPNLATAQLLVETIARDINGHLMARGVSLPVTNENALQFLRTTNQYGAIAAIIKSKKPSGVGMGSDDGAFSYYHSKYTENITQLMDPTFKLLQTASESNETTGFSAGWTKTEMPEGYEASNTPYWTRKTEY